MQESMSKESPYWCVVTVDDLPEGVDEGIALQEGFPEDHEPSLDAGEVRYALLYRTVACDEAEAHSQSRAATQKLGVKTIVDVWTLSTEKGQMVRSERRTVQAMSAGDVSVHGRFIAFKRDNAKAAEKPKTMIALAVSRKSWQFWN
jgi:hypothetical protein